MAQDDAGTEHADRVRQATEKLTGFWTKLMEQNFERLDAVYENWADLEKKSIDQATGAIDEYAKLAKASFDYVSDLNEQVRDLSQETMKSAQGQ